MTLPVVAPSRRHALASLLVGLASLGTLSQTFAGPHEHGVAHLNIALEGSRLDISIKVPLESLLGYERAPRTDAEKAAATALLERFRQGQPVLALPQKAQCKPAGPAQVTAPLIEGQASATTGHGDLQAQYRFDCAQANELREIDVTLFDVSKGLSRVRAQMIGPQGQSQSVLRRNKRQLKLIR